MEVEEMSPIRGEVKSSSASRAAPWAAHKPSKAVREYVLPDGRDRSFFNSSLLCFTSDTGTSSAVGKR
eukprot:6592026-Prorocentrum_lima.AAC.1